MIIKYIWIIGVLLLAIGCHSARSGAYIKDNCPEMTFDIDSLQTITGVQYFAKITYVNRTEKFLNFYYKGRLLIIDNSKINAYENPGWHPFLRLHVDINSQLILEPNEAVFDSITFPNEIYLKMKGKDILVARSFDSKLKRDLGKTTSYVTEEDCVIISKNSVFVP